MRHFVNLDLVLNQLQNFVVDSHSTAPIGVAGRMYYNTVQGTLNYYNTAWRQLVEINDLIDKISATGGNYIKTGSVTFADQYGLRISGVNYPYSLAFDYGDNSTSVNGLVNFPTTTSDIVAYRSWVTSQIGALTTGVSSVFGRTGAVIATSGDYTTTLVTEGTNLYYTNVRARAALSFTAGSGAYNSTTGVITIPTNNNQITNGAGYITSASLLATATGDVAGTVSGTNLPLTLATVNSNVGSFGTSTSVPTFTVNAKGLITAVSAAAIPTATTSITGLLTSTDWNTFNEKFNLPSLTSGSVLFSNGTTIAQDNSNFFWDDTNKRLGVGENTPTAKLDVQNQFKVDGGVIKWGLSANQGIMTWATGEARIGSMVGQALSISSNSNYGANSRIFIQINGNIGVNTTTDAGYKFDVNGTIRGTGNLSLTTAGNKINIATGTNASVGTATFVAGTVTLTSTCITATSRVFCTYTIASGTLAAGFSQGATSANSMVINSITTAGIVNTLDTSTFQYWIIN